MTLEFEEKQPKGFGLIFFSELWERFAFYALQTLLILYMTEQLDFTDRKSFLLFGAYSALLYLATVAGGYLSDKYIGMKRAIYSGGILFFIGYSLLALPSTMAFFSGLSVIIVANGLFKPSMMTFLGEMYPSIADPRRDAGYTLFYMGMNIGAMIPPLFLGFIVVNLGWNWGFGTAAVAMIISLVIFYGGRARIEEFGNLPFNSVCHDPNKNGLFWFLFVIGVALAIAMMAFVLHMPEYINLFFIIASILCLIAVFYFLYKETRIKQLKMLAALALTLISGGFWIFYTQAATSMVLFAKRNMEQELFGFPFNPETILFCTPFFIIILSPLLSKFWLSLAHREKTPSTPTKFAWGILLMSVGYLILGTGTSYYHVDYVVSSGWVVSSYFFQALGELFLSPVGLAMITILSPHKHVGLMMGFWFLIQGAASIIGIYLASFAAVLPEYTRATSLAIYGRAFLIYFWLSFSLAVVAFICIPFINKLMQPTKPQL